MPNEKSGLGVFLFLPIIPALLALGLWLLGVPIDWSSWKTYAGLAVLTIALGIA